MNRRNKGYQPIPSRDADGLPTVRSKGPEGSTQPGRPFKFSDYKVDDSNFETLGLTKIPYGAIALAIFLMVIGMISMVLAWLHVTQEILGKAQAEWGFMFLGLVTFIPGFYHTRIAYYTWKGYRGYSWDMIPSS